MSLSCSPTLLRICFSGADLVRPIARCCSILLLSPALLGGAAAAQAVVDEDFNSPNLNWNYWCPCQINMERSPITFAEDADRPGKRFARIPVDDASLGGNVCRKGPPAFECRPPGAAPPLVAFNFQGAD